MMLRVLLAVLVASIFCVACEDTHSDRCNSVLPLVNYSITDLHGWHLDCAPPFPAPPSESGWANVSSTAGGAIPHTVYLWPDLIHDDASLTMIAGHEDGHVVELNLGHPITGPDAEARASEYSWCNWPEYGVGMPGYGPPPGGCEGFIP